jgi:uncharacterized lipoprotein YmbA
MKRTVLARRGFVCLALPALATACSSPDPVLYTLEMKPGTVQPKGPKIVELRPIALAGYLDRKALVRSSENYRIEVMTNEWWGDQLSAILSRTIVLDLSQRLPASRVYAESGAISADANASVGVNIQRLDLDQSGQLALLAQTAVEFTSSKRSVARTFNITKTPPSPTAAGQVAATSDAVAELADGLAAMLHS